MVGGARLMSGDIELVDPLDVGADQLYRAMFQRQCHIPVPSARPAKVPWVAERRAEVVHLGWHYPGPGPWPTQLVG